MVFMCSSNSTYVRVKSSTFTGIKISWQVHLPSRLVVAHVGYPGSYGEIFSASDGAFLPLVSTTPYSPGGLDQ